MKKITKIILGIIIAVFLVGISVYTFTDTAFDLYKKYNRWNASVESHKIKAGDYTWSYLEGGNQQGETIVFIHGFGADKDRWGKMLKGFTKNYHVIAPDMPGFGETSFIENRNYGIDSQVKRLNKFIQKKGLKFFHLLGISMGGGIAGAYAAKYPEEIKSLALMDAFGVKTKISSDFKKNASENDKILVYKNIKEFDRFLTYIFHKPPRIPKFIKLFSIKKQSKNYNKFSNILLDLRDSGENILLKRLKNISAKTLIIWGKNDRIFHFSASHILNKGIKNSSVKIFENCGHVPYIEKSKETINLYNYFLSSL